jgi:hypothetical protein
MLVNFMAIWCILLPFRIFYGCGHFGMFPVLAYCTKKNLATLLLSLRSAFVAGDNHFFLILSHTQVPPVGNKFKMK